MREQPKREVFFGGYSMIRCPKHHILHQHGCELCYREQQEGCEITGLRGERWETVDGKVIEAEVVKE